MKKIHLTLIALFAITGFLIAQTPTRQWVNFKIDSTTDFFSLSAMAVDANGNSYLTGYEIDEGDEYPPLQLSHSHLTISCEKVSGRFGRGSQERGSEGWRSIPGQRYGTSWEARSCPDVRKLAFRPRRSVAKRALRSFPRAFPS